MLVFEGPDGSGKSTIVQKVSSELGWTIMPRAVSSGADLQADVRGYLREVLKPESMAEDTIFDRFYLISGSIYGPVMGKDMLMSITNAEMMDPEWLTATWSRLQQNGRHFRVVWCLPPIEVVMVNANHDYKTPPPILRAMNTIYWLYYTWAYRSVGTNPYSHFVYDYTSPKAEESLMTWLTTPYNAI